MNEGAARQAASRVLMIRPAAFGPNAETAASNAFQRPLGRDGEEVVRSAAIREHDGLTTTLRDHGVDVLVVEDTPTPVTSDAVFPNNWISFHDDGAVVLYPMLCDSRAAEVRLDVIEAVESRWDTRWPRRLDMTGRRERGEFLEGTGSLVLDRVRGIAYAALSPRTSSALVMELAGELGMRALTFEARARNVPVYHTNVILAVGSAFAVVCGESVVPEDRDRLLESLAVDRELIDVTLDQATRFAANVLELRGADGETVIAMSDAALNALEPSQRARLESHGTLVHAPIPVLERHGGGSVRCTIAEVFPPTG